MSMRKYTPSSHDISGVFVFLLLGVFAVFSTVMVMLGARAYKGSVDRLAEHNADRIAPAYVRSMVRAGDENGLVSVDTSDGVTSVSMRNIFDEDGVAYVTRIYCHDGMLRECFVEDGESFDPEDGEAVCPCDDMTASLEPGLLCVRLRSGDKWTQVDIALHTMR